MLKILGLDLDEVGRCSHYHGSNDIVALKCGSCQAFSACYRCHDAICDHSFKALDKTKSKIILCGACRTLIDWQDYHKGGCPSCHHSFNPKCSRHSEIYFN